MTARHVQKPSAIGVSISDSPDLRVFGLSDGHLRDAMAETALEVLASEWSLAFCGDLRKQGFTEFLAELVVRALSGPPAAPRGGRRHETTWLGRCTSS